MSERLPYVSPSIERLERLSISSMGKHEMFAITPASSFDEPYEVSSLLEQFGSPLFIVSEQTLRAQYQSFLNTFTAKGIETRVAYSYKTNYLPGVISVFLDEGALSEVVSGTEYKLARALGVLGKDIIFNGPFKTREELERAVKDGALIHIDNFNELEALTAVVDKLEQSARLGIRVHFEYGHNPWTKFGFSADNGVAIKVLEKIAKHDRLELVSLHNHSGTFQVDPQVYAQAAMVLLRLVKEARKLGMKPEMLDFGGGYPSRNQLKPEFDVPGGSNFQQDMLSLYAEAILHRVARQKNLFDKSPIVVLEPGRTVVDTAVRLACTVVSTKKNPDHGDAIVVDAGVNILPTAYWYDHEIERAKGTEKKEVKTLRPVSVFGPLCMQIDVVRERALLPPLSVGDPLLISNVGAYCQTQSMQFIHTRPATILLGPDGPEVIRQRETWRDFFCNDSIPARLRPPNADF